MSFRERGVAATTLDPNEKTFRVPFEGAGGLSFYLRHLPASTKGSTRKAVLYAHGARLASAVTIAHRFDGLSWRDDLAADGWDVWGLDYVGYGGADRYAAMLEPPEANPPLCRAEEASQQIERAADFITQHSNLSSISIIAHSWGTNAASLMAISRPELVDRLVMFGPVTHRPGAGGQAPFVPAWQYITVEAWWKTFTADVPAGEKPVLDEQHFKIWGQAYLACDTESGERTPNSVKTPWGALTDVSELWSGGKLFEPAEIKAPTLIVRGEWDSYSNDADAKWLFDSLKQAPVKRDVKIARATHFMHFEENRFDLYEETRAFLGGEKARTRARSPRLNISPPPTLMARHASPSRSFLMPGIKTAAVICHARFLDLASFGEILGQKGYDVRYYDAGQDSLSLDGEPDVLITLGGPVGAYERSDYPWIDDEMEVLAKHLSAGRPLLAICLGAEILAQTLGARVFKGSPEIGWAPIELTDAGRQSVLRRTGEEGVPVLHWHGDSFDLPVGAQRLASTPRCENQAFTIGSALAVQFHPEVRARDFERWLICNTGQIAAMADHSVTSLRQQAQLHANTAAIVGQDWLAQWLDRT